MLPLVFLAAALILLAVVPTSRYYPPCLFHQVTGLLCPGCGATRALAALLHGHLDTALHLNALVVLFLPLILIYAILIALRQPRLAFPAPAIAAAVLVTAIFTVARNLP